MMSQYASTAEERYHSRTWHHQVHTGRGMGANCQSERKRGCRVQRRRSRAQEPQLLDSEWFTGYASSRHRPISKYVEIKQRIMEHSPLRRMPPPACPPARGRRPPPHVRRQGKPQAQLPLGREGKRRITQQQC